MVGTAALTFVVFTSSSGGDVSGPSAATDNALARFDATSGKAIQSSTVTLSDAGDLAGVKTLSLSGASNGTVALAAQAVTSSHTLILPAFKGEVGDSLQILNATSGALTWGTRGDVVGAGASTDNAVARYDATTGKRLQNSAVTISDSADIAGARTLALSGATAGTVTLAPAASGADHTLTLPADRGAQGTFLQSLGGSGALAWAAAGNVSSASVSTDNAVPRFDSTSGKLLQNSAVTISDAGGVAGVRSLALSGAASGSFTLAPASATVPYAWTLPAGQAPGGAYLTSDASGNLGWGSPPGLGDVNGPCSADAQALARFDGTTGKLIKSSAVTLSDGGAISGVTTLGVAGVISGVATPLAPGDAANKQYVDGAVSGLRWKDPVRFASTTNIAGLQGPVDGYSVSAGDRILVRAQADGRENGVYVASAGFWARAADLAAGASAAAAAFFASAGTENINRSFVCTNAAGGDVVGTAALVFVVFASTAGGDVAGPASAGDNAVARFDTTTGKVLQNSVVFIGDAGGVSGVASLSLSGASSGAVAIVPAAATATHILTADKGAQGTFLQSLDSNGTLAWANPGNVTGAASSTDIAVARFDSTTGKLLQNSVVAIDDGGVITGARALYISGAVSGAVAVQASPSTDPHVLMLPQLQGGENAFLRNDGTGALTWTSAGNVTGAASSADNAFARFDSTTDKVLQNSVVFIGDTGSTTSPNVSRGL